MVYNVPAIDKRRHPQRARSQSASKSATILKRF